jgi:hypothetical protein
MDNLHNKTLIPQAHVVVDFTIEFVDSLDDPNYYGSTFALVFVDYVGSPSIIIDGNFSTTITIDEVFWSMLVKQRDIWKPKSCNVATLAFYATNNVLITPSKVNSTHPEHKQ